jgi:hypothetical protein
MKDHSGMIRGFYHFSEAWYADANRNKDCVDEVMIGFYGPNGDQGTAGEFSVRWTELGSEITPQLQAYDDSWYALAQFSDLIEAMGEIDGKDVSPKTFCELLKSLGFKDLTPRKNPYALDPPSKDRVIVDQVFALKDGFYCIVDGEIYGTWETRAIAEAGMQVEQRRTEARKQKANAL